MAESGPAILRKAREAADLSREELSERLKCISSGTIKRWEYGESRPESSDVARVGQIIGEESLWPRWMCAVDEEYARRHPYHEEPNQAVVAVINAGYQMADVTALTEALSRDLMDGKVDNQPLAAQWISEAEEAIAALRGAVDKLKKGG